MGPVNGQGRLEHAVGHRLRRGRRSGVPCFDLLNLEQRGGFGRRDLAFEAALDDLERQEVLALLPQYPAKTVYIVVVELAVARGRPLRDEQPPALEEADLRDRDIGKLLPQQREDIAN